MGCHFFIAYMRRVALFSFLIAAAAAALVLNLERQCSKERTKNRETERVARVGVVRLGKIYLTDYTTSINPILLKTLFFYYRFTINSTLN
jgi:hypothetical protein